MILLDSSQCSLEDTVSTRFDLIVAAAGYESRCIHVPQLVASAAADRRIALAFTDRRRTGSRSQNNGILRSLGYELMPAVGNEANRIQEIVVESIVEGAGGEVNLLVDYTGMTRVWYGGVLSLIRSLVSNHTRVTIYFTYSPSSYSQPRTAMPNEIMAPVPGFSSLAMPDVPTALVVGLGYERERALGLVEFVEPGETYAFYASPTLDPRFESAVVRNNTDILSKLGDDRVFQYPLSDLRASANLLTSLSLGLSKDGYRLILAPLGPKPFTLLCFLYALRYPAADVWRVSAGSGGRAYDRTALGPVIICRARFGNED